MKNYLIFTLLAVSLTLNVTAGGLDREPQRQPVKKQRVIEQEKINVEELIRRKQEQRKPVKPPRRQSRRTKTVTLSNGITLPYVEQGDPAGVPMLLLHGYSDSWRSFEPVLPHLPASLHVFALTQRGHGEATRPATGYCPQDFAADVAGFMDALKLKRAVIVGHSMGSYVAQRFALDYPERTQGLVLIGSFITLRGNAAVQELWETVSKLTDPVNPTFVREFQQSTIAKPVPPTHFNTVVRESLKVSARVWRAALDGLRQADFTGELGRIEAPTLIIWGDQDSLFLRPEQEALAKAITGSQLLVYRGVGHCPPWEDPERCAADLVAFTKHITN